MSQTNGSVRSAIGRPRKRFHEQTFALRSMLARAPRVAQHPAPRNVETQPRYFKSTSFISGAVSGLTRTGSCTPIFLVMSITRRRT